MAIIMKKDSTLRRQAQKIYIILGFLYLATLLTFFTHIPFLPYFMTMITLGAQGRSLITLRGYQGEKKVLHTLQKLPDTYYIFNDVNIVVAGHQAQLDHVVLSPDGTIWSIETKSHIGTVYGSDHLHDWLQVKRYGYKTFKEHFYSPVMQNIVHCKRLSDYLEGLTGHKYFVRSVVIFTSATLKVTSKTPVIGLRQLMPLLTSASNTPVRADPQQVYNLAHQLNVILL